MLHAGKPFLQVDVAPPIRCRRVCRGLALASRAASATRSQHAFKRALPRPTAALSPTAVRRHGARAAQASLPARARPPAATTVAMGPNGLVASLLLLRRRLWHRRPSSGDPHVVIVLARLVVLGHRLVVLGGRRVGHRLVVLGHRLVGFWDGRGGDVRRG